MVSSLTNVLVRYYFDECPVAIRTVISIAGVSLVGKPVPDEFSIMATIIELVHDVVPLRVEVLAFVVRAGMVSMGGAQSPVTPDGIILNVAEPEVDSFNKREPGSRLVITLGQMTLPPKTVTQASRVLR